LTEVVVDINGLLCRLTRGRKYATLVICEWNQKKHTLTWVGAGHPPLLIEAAGGVREYASTGPPVGLLEDGTYGRHTVHLDEGDTVLLYTDGLLEAGGEEGGEEFGVSRIGSGLSQGGGTAAVVARLQEALGAHLGDADPSDDVTILCFRRPKVQ
jgi:serine phosphatase RsbU (regulator of sigma subunit)